MIDLNAIKEKSCVDYLESKGFHLEKKSSDRYSFFKSPFRDERTASFCVNNSKNTWFDYGAGFGGDIIKLVEIIEEIDFKSAIEQLNNSEYREVKFTQPKSPIEIINVRPLQRSYLIGYLISRKIDVDLAKIYLKEIQFKLYGRPKLAIGFENDKGGFELRNEYLKISTSPKWITTINGNEKQNVFEGFMDFLSLISKYKKVPKETCIILNSVSLIGKAEIKEGAKFFGDNDKAGDECFLKMPKAIDKRGLFAGYKDINDWLMNKK